MQSRYFYIFLTFLSLVVAFYFVKSTLSLYSAKNALGIAENNLSKLKAENESIKKEISYRKTDQYVINEAREKLNYGFEGESILIVPKNALRPTDDVQVTSSEGFSSSATKTIDTNNSTVKLWLNVFF